LLPEGRTGTYAKRSDRYPPGQHVPSKPTSKTDPLPTQARAASPRPHRVPDAETRDLALRIAQRLDERQARDIAILDVSGPFVIADYFVIATVTSTRQGQALAKELDQEHKALRGRRRINQGGRESEESNWVLLDFDDIVVHLFLPEARSYYDLETMWADAPRLPFTPAPKPAAAPTEIRQPTIDGFGAFQPGAKADGDDDAQDD
jgi:ribosome-associated protein